jgi:HlyD family secretion protein
MNKKILFSIILMTASGLALTACNVIEPTDETNTLATPVSDPGMIAEANLVPTDFITLGFAIPGRVAEVLVEEGDDVEEGEVLARLGDVAALEAQVSAAEAAVLEAQYILDDLNENVDLAGAQAQVELIQARQALVEAEKAWDVVDTDEFREDLDDARIEMNDAEADLEEAQEDVADHDDLAEDNPIREGYEEDLEVAQQVYDEAAWAFETLQNESDLAEVQLEAAQALVADAEGRVEDTRDGPDPDALALAEAGLESAQAQLEAAESALGDSELTAPFSGKIVMAALIENTDIEAGKAAFVLIDDSQWFLETTDLTENEVVRIDEDGEVSISFDALPGVSFTGEVESISEYFVEQYGDITYVVRIRLLEYDGQLRWGMTAEVNFIEE